MDRRESSRPRAAAERDGALLSEAEQRRVVGLRRGPLSVGEDYAAVLAALKSSRRAPAIRSNRNVWCVQIVSEYVVMSPRAVILDLSGQEYIIRR